MSTQTAVRTQALPRVNLLPPEIEEGRKLQQLKVVLGATVLGSVGVVLALYLAAVGQAHSAQSDLDNAQATHTQLLAQAAQYSDVPKTKAQVSNAQTQLAQAMGQEVRWSFVLNDLGLRMPSAVWLDKVTINENLDSTTAATGATGSAQQPLFTAGLGQMTFEGSAVKHTDVAAWLDSIAREKGLNQIFMTKSEEKKDDASGQTVVGYTSQATITSDALSKRYTTKAGS